MQTSEMISYYKRMLNAAPGFLEAAGANNKMSDVAIDFKTTVANDEIRRLRENSDATPTEARKLTENINKNGKDIIKSLLNNNVNYFNANSDAFHLLEVIVKMDGSRPSFLIKDGTVDLSGASAGLWTDIITANRTMLDKAIAAVGRVQLGEVHVGTGFLLSENVLMTNRHVLQELGVENADGSWRLNKNAAVDFGYEFQSIGSFGRRGFDKVLFAGPEFVDKRKVDHTKLDLAVIELLPASDDITPHIFGFDATAGWAAPDKKVYTIGYPANPGLAGLNIYGSVLVKLFQATYSYKRLSPGEVISIPDMAGYRTVCHDASTLGGNSGSPVIAVGNESLSAALHYGGTISAPRQNWAHQFSKILTVKDRKTNMTLEKTLSDNGVDIIR